MRHYSVTTVRVGGFLDTKVETWSEHNHAQVYSGGSQIFDGYALEAETRVHDEVTRLVECAKSNGLSVEII